MDALGDGMEKTHGDKHRLGPNRGAAAGRTLLSAALLLLLLLLSWGCSHVSRETLEKTETTLYLPDRGETGTEEAGTAARFCPAFIAYDTAKAHNRIGGPAAAVHPGGAERIFVDPDRPAVYYRTRAFSTEKGTYTNLIYRVHFPGVPYSLFPFHLSAGKNVGLLTVITLDAAGTPVLLTSSATCGCYAVIIPTDHLPEAAYPDGWREGRIDLYGETLPARLDVPLEGGYRPVIRIRPGEHRVMDIFVASDTDLLGDGELPVVRPPLIPAERLEALPLDGRATSFFDDRWPRSGFVKGSYKPLETLLLGLVSLDFFVGSDKKYGDTAVTGNPFYTSLKPWNRRASDMWYFRRFLRFWGWKL